MTVAGEELKVKVSVDTEEAMQRVHLLRDAAVEVGELLEVKRDLGPYLLALGGWVFALVALLVR